MLCNQNINQFILTPCHQEEANTRMFLHAFDASNASTKKIMIRTVDTDVVVIGKIQFSWFVKDKYQLYHGIVLLLLYIVLLCLRYLWVFFFFSKQVLDCLINCKWRSYGSGFVLEKLNVIFHCTSWFAVFDQNILLCPYFMLSQDAIRFHFFRQKAKRQAGKHGESMMNSQLLFNWFHFALLKMISQLSFT